MRVARLFHVDISISKLLILFLLAFIIGGYGDNISLIFLVFIIHESAHIITARLLGLNVKEIELLPFGGAVHLESVFELNPGQEILIAIAGPVSNILMLLGYFALVQAGLIEQGPSRDFVNTNLILAGFNLLPALPLDGGRILRAALSREIGIKKATRIGAWAGLVLALVLFTIGLYGLLGYGIFNMSLFFLSGFLAYSALKEKRAAGYILLRDISYKKEALLKDGSMPIRNIAVLYNMPLREVVKRFTPYRYHYIQVLDDQLKEMGRLNEGQVIEGIVDYAAYTQIGRLLNK